MTFSAPDTTSETALDQVARRLQSAIGLRPGGVSALRLRHAAQAVATRRGVSAGVLPMLLEHDPSCRQELVDQVTVQESQFFRDTRFFAALQSTILPALGDGGETLTVWSAGCAHGQEAYSVAMLLAEAARPAWRVVATDVSARALAAAGAGSFAERELRGLSTVRRDRFLQPNRDGRHVVVPALRERVEFTAHNLIRDPVPAGAASARLVLLRNVLIYFEPATIAAVLGRLARSLPTGAWILLGGSEVLQPAPGLELVRVAGVYGYRVTGRREQPEPPAKAAPRTATAAAVAAAARPAARRPPAQELTPHEVRARAEAHSAAGEHAQAIRGFRQLVYLDGRDVDARLALALSFQAAGDVGAAIRSLRAAATAVTVCSEIDDPEPAAGWGSGEMLALIDERLAALEGSR